MMFLSHPLPSCLGPSIKANPRYTLGWEETQEFGGTWDERAPGSELEPIILPDL